ncbi:hypothetical protein [Nonomuraea coxensis]|uniref:hypothetical protein n=1 Tax=Nonomuraea coxensis TaxID=404386 RepID=UPI0012FB9961|nr:hypothetical protein [Nonomuraea coxensis]
MTGQPDLPDAWWRTLPVPHVLAAIGPEALAELLTEIALEHWPAAAVGDVLPALHVLDPEEADEPPVAIALDRAGSWTGLLALTGRELADQPFIRARPVLSTLFAAVFTRLAQPLPLPAAPEAPAVPETPEADEPAAAHTASARASTGPQPPAAPAEDSERVASEQAPVQGLASVAPAEEAPAEEAPAEEAPTEEADRAEEHEAPGHAAPAEPGDAPADAARAEDGEVLEEAVSGAEEDEAPADAARAEDGGTPEGAASGAEGGEAPGDDVGGGEEGEPAAHAFAAVGQAPAHAFAASRSSEDGAPAHAFAAAAEEAGRPVLDADAEPAADAGDGPEPTPDSVEEPAPEPAAAEAEALEADGPASGAPTEDDEVESQEDQGAQELPELIEAAFAGLDDKSWAVAQNRVFTDEPSAVDQLAKLFAVPPSEITATEEDFRVRLGEWLDSDEAAPFRAHLDELRRTLGPEAPKERVIGAADWHRTEIRALEVPAWQVVLATLPGKQAVLAAPAVQAAPPPPVDLPPPPPPRLDPVLHFDAPRQPPMDMPPQSAFGPVPLPPSPPPGPPQFQAFKPVASHEQNGGSGEQKPYQPLKDVSQTRRCFRQPDGRWWLRVDVTAEQMAGGECALPTGFAAYLGLSPGETRTVRSAAGELTMTWHGRPVLESIEHLLGDVGAREGGHLFLTLSDEGVLRARHLPVAAQGAEKITKALRLVGYTAPGGTRDQAARVIATRIGMTGPVSLPDLLTRLRERGDRDLLALLD